MEIFAGECCFGPFDGQMLAHWTKVKKFYRTLMPCSMNVESARVEVIEIGEYQYLEDATGKPAWFWRETDAGRAPAAEFPTRSSSRICLLPSRNRSRNKRRS